MSKLPSDQYYIRNGDNFAGRNQHEDRSLNPKGVFCPADGDSELWIIEALDNGRYKLRARGAPTGVINNLLYAFIIDEDRAEEWIITKRTSDSNRILYTIEKASRDAGWVAQPDTEEYHQIAVRPLRATTSEPLQFLPTELWNIQPLVD